jgi:hypothetical protein
VAPTTGQIFAPGDNVKVVAAVEGDFDTQKVDVFFDGILKDSLTAAPYELSITLPNNVQTGNHKVTVVAQDNNPNTEESKNTDEKIFRVQPGGATPTPSPSPSPTPTPTVPAPTPTKPGGGAGGGRGQSRTIDLLEN